MLKISYSEVSNNLFIHPSTACKAPTLWQRSLRQLSVTEVPVASWTAFYFETLKVQLFQASQLFEDLEASGGVLTSARRFAGGATAVRIEVAAREIQPGGVRTIRVFEAHNVTILHRRTINGVSGVDHECSVTVGQPAVSRHREGCPRETKV